MAKPRYTSQPGSLNLFTKAQLDEMTVGIEFTLISLAQGLALAELASRAINPLTTFQFTVWPYILAGLIIILYYWSQAIIHALCFINWPISLRHNFIYFLFMLVEVVMFSQITIPQNWFALNFIFGGVTWLFYYLDLGLIQRREPDFLTPEQKVVYQELVANHKQALRLWVPLGALYMLTAWLLILFYPTVFIEQSWHLALIAGQVLIGLIILVRSIRYFHWHSDLICDVKNPRY